MTDSRPSSNAGAGADKKAANAAASSVAAFRTAAAAKLAASGGSGAGGGSSDASSTSAADALLKFYRKAAESGNPSAQLSLALRLLKGDAHGVVDIKEVVDLLTKVGSGRGGAPEYLEDTARCTHSRLPSSCQSTPPS